MFKKNNTQFRQHTSCLYSSINKSRSCKYRHFCYKVGKFAMVMRPLVWPSNHLLVVFLIFSWHFSTSFGNNNSNVILCNPKIVYFFAFMIISNNISLTYIFVDDCHYFARFVKPVTSPNFIVRSLYILNFPIA